MNIGQSSQSNALTPVPESLVESLGRGCWTRRLLWLYCIMWLAEGALRKWVLPQLSQELLLVRDPIVLLLYGVALMEGVFPKNSWLMSLAAYSVFSLFQGILQVTSGDVPLPVAVFGFRTLILHLPLIWIVPEVLSHLHVRRLGLAVLLLAPPFAVLMVAQFTLSSDHWLNSGALGGGQIGSVGEHIRPAAVFSFITGPIHFYTICTAFCLAGFLSPKLFPRSLLIAAATATLMAMSVSGSRSLVLGCIIVAAAGMLASSGHGSGLARGIVFTGIMAVVFFGLTKLSFFQEGQAVLNERWAAGEGEQGEIGVADRYLGTFMGGFRWAAKAPLLGYGLGSTSNLASLVYHRIAPVESEWERIFYEVGAVGGFPYILYRVCFAGSLVLLAIRTAREGNYFCPTLVAACCLDMLTGNFRQSTTLGFACVCCGLCLVAARHALQPDAISSPTALLPKLKPSGKREIRGRGPFSVSNLVDP